MEESPVAHNCGKSPVADAAGGQVGHVEVQEKLGSLINRLASTSVSCWWKLQGDDPNSISQLLDTKGEDMRLVLRKCRVLYGPKDSFRTSEFEDMAKRIGFDWNIYRPHGKPIYFLQVGDQKQSNDAINKPKEMYSIGGVLEYFPMRGVHMPGIRTKGSRRLAADIVMMSSPVTAATTPTGAPHDAADADKQNNKGTMTLYINDFLEVVRHELNEAADQGNKYSYSQRLERILRKAAIKAIRGSVGAFVEDWVERMGEAKEECVFSTPANDWRRTSLPNLSNASSTIQPRDIAKETTPKQRVQLAHPLITPPLDLTEENDDESDFAIVLSRMKEETMLQNLLHKRLLNNQRVLLLEHKNGRRLRVILYPDAQSIKSFVDEAKRSQWVNKMLHSDVQKEGLLVFMVKTQPDMHLRVAKERKLRVTVSVLNTPETLALGRLTGVNDTQMCKLRSFLRHVGNAELQLS